MAGARVQPSPGSTSMDLNPVPGQGSKAVNGLQNTVSSETAEISGPRANAWLGLGCGSEVSENFLHVHFSAKNTHPIIIKHSAESDMSWHT